MRRTARLYLLFGQFALKCLDHHHFYPVSHFVDENLAPSPLPMSPKHVDLFSVCPEALVERMADTLPEVVGAKKIGDLLGFVEPEAPVD